MPGLCVQQSWYVKNGSEWSLKECFGRSWLNEWCALTLYGRGFQKEEGGKFLGCLFPWKKFLGHRVSLTAQITSYTCQMCWPILNRWERGVVSSGGGMEGWWMGVKAVRIIPFAMRISFTGINRRKYYVVWMNNLAFQSYVFMVFFSHYC